MLIVAQLDVRYAKGLEWIAKVRNGMREKMRNEVGSRGAIDGVQAARPK
jgi:hypothetical protein